MALVLTSATGALFNRLGKIFYTIKSINTYLASGDLSAGGLKSLGVTIDGIDAQFASTRQDIVTALYPNRDAARQALNTMKSQLAALAQTVVIEMTNDDHPLSSKTIQPALVELIRQMTGAATVDACTTSVTPTAGTNYGTQTLIASIKGPSGLNREYAEAETITVTCTSDVGTGTASLGVESWRATGVTAVPNNLDWNWPLGSGCDISFSSVAAANGGLNLLANGDFELFTVANTADYWQVTTGSIGTTIKSSTGSYMGTYALQFVGTGAELTTVYQVFDDSTNGTGNILQPNTVYGVACYVKVSATPAAGVLELAITNSAGTIIQDDQAVDQKITKALTAVSTTYVLVSGFFTTPRILPTGTLRFRCRLSTALDNAKTVNIDNLTLGLATQAYQGGIQMMMVPGSIRSAIGDVHSAAVANDQAGEFQSWFQRCFNIRSFGLQLPSDNAAGESILDSLIA